MMDDEFEIEMSPLCQTMRVDDKTVQVDIYRGETESWVLEVVDEYGTSTIWNDQFSTDLDALAVVKKIIREEGIDALINETS
ncbi:hypothetical protein [Marinicella pacifica]|nr:hypothetical protein [Marinicella pacifica]